MRAPVPLRVVAAHGVGGGLERVAAIELERLVVAFVLAPQPGEGLHRRRRQVAEQLGEVRAAARCRPSSSCRRLRNPCTRLAPTSFPYAGSMRSQAPGYGMLSVPPRSRGSRTRVSIVTRTHMSCTASPRGAHAGQQLEVVVLGVDQVRLDVEQAVVAAKAFVGDAALVQALARNGAGRERHRTEAETGGREDRLQAMRGRIAALATMTRQQRYFTLCRRRAATRRAFAPRSITRIRMSYVLALDQGTTSSRAIVFDHAGAVKASAQREFRQIFPQPGWVEHDATEIWATQSGVHARSARQGRHRAADIAAIGITNQRETTVLWERATGRPIANAIVWQDRRTAAQCDELRAAGHAPNVRGEDGPRHRRLFLGHQAQVAARSRARRARARGARRARVRHRRLVARLATDRRAARTSPTRRTRAARCSSTSTPATGTTSCCGCSTSRGAVLPRIVAVVRRLRRGRSSTASRCRSRASPATSRRRCSARRAIRRDSRRTPTAPAASC